MAMLAPYPDRLRSSRSTSHASEREPQQPQPQHSLFHSRSSLLPFTGMRTNNLEADSSDSPAAQNDTVPVPPRPPRNPARLHDLPPRPSTPSDHKHTPVVPIVVTSPFAGASPVPFADFMPTRRRSTKRPSFARKESASSKGSSTHAGHTKRDLSTPDRQLGVAHRESQFKMKDNKKHHAYPANEAPYPLNYERPVIDHDVWETGFIRQLSGSQTFHVFETPPTKVLDLGCGSGHWILECAKLWRNCEFVGLDLVPLHPNLSRLRSSNLSSRITWVKTNCLQGLPFSNEEFDFVHIKRLAHGIPEDKWDFLLDEISRVMKPGAAIEMVEEDLFFPGGSPDSSLPSRTPTPVPASNSVTLPSSSHHLPNEYNTNDKRNFFQHGSVTTTNTTTLNPLIYSSSPPSTMGSASVMTLPTLLRNTDTTNLSGCSDFEGSRPGSGAPLNPRDHSLLEYIYTEMHASRFINLSPLSLLANSLPVYFENVRSHAPIMFMFPPSDLTRVKRQLPGSSGEKGDLGTSKLAEHHRGDSSQTGLATLIYGREILHHTQQYVILDESAVAPGTMTARQKATSSSLHLACTTGNSGTPTQNKFPSTSSLISSEASLGSERHSTSTAPTEYSHATTEDYDAARRLNTLPNQRLKFDLQSLNLHLSMRVTGILACAEAMWEWVCKYQDAQRAHRGQHHIHRGERGDTDRFSAELVGMSRAEFDVLLTRFELDMRDCINMESRITSAFHAPAPALAQTNDRKAFDNACKKWEEHQIKQRARRRARAATTIGIQSQTGTDPPATELLDFDDGEAAGPTGQRLSRTFRVFCAWKAS
ncbi:hypothetical protein BJV78DRAFT_351287 [Lactifluus subvellereus]|nr:hypothetical protein BJV78DRAFT_351287 [Lactifluus subvellereus]